VDVPISFDGLFSSEHILKCPKCSESNLHQERVEALFRDEESGPGTLTVSDRASGMSTVLRVEAKNIDFRRDAVYIHFTCEHCTSRPILEIRQDRGSTWFTWLTPEERAKRVG